MILAVSGQLFMGVVGAGAVFLLIALMRAETRADIEEEERDGRRPPRRRRPPYRR